MVERIRLPKYLQDKVMETYEIPLVGKVEIRKNPITGRYVGWISGWGMVYAETSEDLTATRNFVGDFACNLAKRRFEDAKKTYEEISRPYTKFLYTVGKSAKGKKDWMQKYRDSSS